MDGNSIITQVAQTTSNSSGKSSVAAKTITTTQQSNTSPSNLPPKATSSTSISKSSADGTLGQPRALADIKLDVVAHDEENTDNEDASSPFQKSNELKALDTNATKNVKKARKKNLFRSFFCCFSTTSRSKSTDSGVAKNYSPTANNFVLNADLNSSNLTPAIQTNQSSVQNNSTSSTNSITPPTFQANASDFNANDYSKSDSVTTNATPIKIDSTNQAQLSENNNECIKIEIVEKQDEYDEEQEKYLLQPIALGDSGKKCLIIDLDETLVHSSFKQVHNADFVVPVEIDGMTHQVYVLKRPHVDEFLKRMGELFECVLFTASLAKYADPVADLLDKWGVFRARLFREACVFYRGNYVKDLGRLGRDLTKVIILDNSPASYIFHPDNAVACASWFDDACDNELMELIPYFERLASVDNVYTILKQNHETNQDYSHMNTNIQIHQMNAAVTKYANMNLLPQQQQQKQQQPQSVLNNSSIYIHRQQSGNQQLAYDENQQVPCMTPPPSQSIIYQQQPQSQHQPITNMNNLLQNVTNSYN